MGRIKTEAREFGEGDYIPDARKATKAQVCVWFAISNETLTMWIRRECPVRKKGGPGVAWEFDLYEVARWRFSGTSKKEKEVDPDNMSPKERLEWYRSEHARIQLEKERGRLVPFDVVEKAVSSILVILRAGLLGQHSDIAGRFPTLPKGVINGILEANRALLKRMSKSRLPDEIEHVLDRLDGSAKTSGEQDGK